MLTQIKKHLPQPLKRALAPAYQRTIGQWKKRRLFSRMQKKHQELLAQIKGKERIRVVFLVIHKSVWKVDPVFQKMLADQFFEPIILVCPYTSYGDERMWQDMEECYEHFEQKGYPLLSAYNKEEQRWILLEEIQPDIVFFTNPHDLTRKEYYKDAYLKYLSCYVPYAHDVSRYDNYNSQYNQFFHNAIWKIFVPHSEDLCIFKSYSQNKGKNIVVTGYPACEVFFSPIESNPWKLQESNKLKVIWAPHHTIADPSLPYSNFLEFAAFFRRLSYEFKSRFQFAFKPHPILKSKLFSHADWGVEKTNEYYEYWKNGDNTQLDEGDYADLFKTSDCMIHDSGSFLAEYHYVQKPVVYTNNDNIRQFLNPFGEAAMNSCIIETTQEGISRFLTNMEKHSIGPDLSFFNEKLNPYFTKELPSTKILLTIKEEIN